MAARLHGRIYQFRMANGGRECRDRRSPWSLMADKNISGLRHRPCATDAVRGRSPLPTGDKSQLPSASTSLGFDLHRGGWPGSNERDAAFFKEDHERYDSHANDCGVRRDPSSGVRSAADRTCNCCCAPRRPVATVVGQDWKCMSARR